MSMNSENETLNPDSTMLRQSEGHWQKYLCLVLWKLAREGVTITLDDMVGFANQDKNVLLTYGHIDSIEFKLVTRAEAERVAAYDKQQKGSA